jgi:hypothetical protein
LLREGHPDGPIGSVGLRKLQQAGNTLEDSLFRLIAGSLSSTWHTPCNPSR